MTSSADTISSLLILSLGSAQLLVGCFFFYLFESEFFSKADVSFFKKWGISYFFTAIGLILTCFTESTSLTLLIFCHNLLLLGLVMKFSALREMAGRPSYFYECASVIFLACLIGVSSSNFGVTISPYYLATVSFLISAIGLGIAWAAKNAFTFKSPYKTILSINFLALALLHLTRAIVIISHPVAFREDNLINTVTYTSGLIFCLVGAFSVIGLGYEKLTHARLSKENRKYHSFETTMLGALNKIAHARSLETGAHTVRTQHTAQLISIRLKEMGLHQDRITDDFIQFIFLAAPLHDIGKIAIPDAIIHKPGKLTEEEWEIMKTHASTGEDILNSVEAELESKTDSDLLLEIARNIAGGHHEKWNGTGYPKGLKGKQIPIEARIMSIADQYDALLSVRCYKKAWLPEDALNEIIDGSGTFFDPEVVAAFMKEIHSINQIYLKYADNA